MSAEIYANLLPRVGARSQPQPYSIPQPSLRRPAAAFYRRDHNSREEEAEYDNIYVQVTSPRQQQEAQETDTGRNTAERGSVAITGSPETSINRERSRRGYIIIALFSILLVISLIAAALAVAALTITLVHTHESEVTEDQEMDNSTNITRKSLWGLSVGGIGGRNIPYLATVRGVQPYQNCTTDTYNTHTAPTTQSSILASVLSTRWTTTNKIGYHTKDVHCEGRLLGVSPSNTTHVVEAIIVHSSSGQQCCQCTLTSLSQHVQNSTAFSTVGVPPTQNTTIFYCMMVITHCPKISM